MELRGRLPDLQLENEILKKAAVILGTKPQAQSREMIHSIKEKTGASIRKICVVVDYPESTYYAAAKPTPTQLED